MPIISGRKRDSMKSLSNMVYAEKPTQVITDNNRRRQYRRWKAETHYAHSTAIYPYELLEPSDAKNA